MSKTANPAVIIGLGGTGQWVLTYVKKNLIDTYGEVPETVRLLAFDTTSPESDAAVEAEQREESAQVGDITLDQGEFVYLGGNIRRICEEIRDENKHKHISNWLQARYYLSAQDDDAYEITKGAGRRRPFGRMAVFYDLMQGQPKVWGKIEQALTDVKAARGQTRPVEIYIVCSLAGGTGSGMFIDVAHLAKAIARRQEIAHAIRGFIVLHNTFEPVARIADARPKTFAALRELERFMLVFDRDYPMYYTDDPNKRFLQTVYKSKLFDNCYLLDAKRTKRPLDNIKPKLGVFPSIADSIMVLLDPQTGDTFDQHYKNVNERLATAQKERRQALYSSLGTFTYILPVDDIIERNTLKLAIELLRDHLVGLKHDEDLGTIEPDSMRVQEYTTLPREEAMSFLRMEQSRSNIRNMIFTQNMATALGQPLDQLNVIQGMAEQGVGLLSWLEPVEQDETMVQAGNRIESVLQTSLITQVPTAKETGEDFVTAANRIIQDIRDIRTRMLGQEEEGGRRKIGEFEMGLRDYRRRNEARYRRLLSEKLLLILNGATDNQVVAKTGKLPYARDFLVALIRAFEDFGTFLNRVIEHRAKEGSISIAREYVQQTRQTMLDTVYANSIFDRMRGTALKAEDAYIENEDFLFELEREEIIYQEMLRLTNNLRDISKKALESIESWIEALALGGAPGTNETGIYQELLRRQADLKRRRDEQRRIEVWEYLIDDVYEDKLYQARINESRLGEILRRFDWQLTEEDEDFKLRLFYDGQRRPDEGMPEFKWQVSRYQASATKDNAKLLLDNLRPYFQDMRNETIADRMEEALTPARAAKALLESSDALLSYSGHEQPLLERHNMICVNQGIQVNYFNELEEELKKSAPHDKDNQVIGLSNKHRCTILSTLDLVVGQHITPYETTARDYREHRGDRKLLHNFPAEVNASEYERKLSQPPLNEVSRLLSPELVALLEDKELARLFVLALVFGLIREEEVPGARVNQFTLRVDTLSRRERRDNPYKVALTRPSELPDLLEAMTNFVFVHLDPEQGIRAIKDVTPDTNILIEPEKISESLERLEDSIVSGREKVVQEFAAFLESGELGEGKGKVATILKDDGRHLLVSAFRVLLSDIERYLNLNELDRANEAIQQMVEDNMDTYEEGYGEILAAAIQEFIKQYAGGRGIQAGNYNRLIERLEGYIDSEVQKLRNVNNNQLINDLGSLMYLLLWGEIERLERLRDQVR